MDVPEDKGGRAGRGRVLMRACRPHRGVVAVGGREMHFQVSVIGCQVGVFGRRSLEHACHPKVILAANRLPLSAQTCPLPLTLFPLIPPVMALPPLPAGLRARRDFLRQVALGAAMFAVPGAFAEALTRTPKQTEEIGRAHV